MYSQLLYEHYVLLAAESKTDLSAVTPSDSQVISVQTTAQAARVCGSGGDAPDRVHSGATTVCAAERCD